MTPALPFRDGQRFTIDDDQHHSHTVVCRHTPATPSAAGGFTRTTAGGLPVVYLPDTGQFRIPILGCLATRRA
jgi:hypothetical protein